MSSTSSKHHYIPRFLINGFTNDSGLLYVYDKKLNIIFPNLRSPKSVFFELHRNSIIDINNEYNSIIEDTFFQKLDNLSSKLIRRLQFDDIKTAGLIDSNSQGLLHLFLMNLFWRIPYTDYAFESIFNDTNIFPTHIEAELKQDSTFRKIQRTLLFKKTIEDMDDGSSNREYYGNLKKFNEAVFVLGDNPILFETLPTTYKDLSDLEFLFAVSSKRMFSMRHKESSNFILENILKFNALIINQSIQYVCSPNKHLLELSIEYSKIINNNVKREQIRKALFK